MGKDLILRKIAISVEEMDRLWEQQAEMAQALQYLLLLEEHAGFGKSFEVRSTSEFNKKIAEDMGVSVATLTAKRREWTKDGVLAEARAYLAPLQLEQQQILADMVMGNYADIMQQFLKTALSSESDVYSRIAAWKVLKSDVLMPALSNKKADDQGDEEYAKRMKELEISVDDADDYLANSLEAGE